MKTYGIGYSGIEDYLYDVRKALIKKACNNPDTYKRFNTNQAFADYYLAPLAWYIGTGRACLNFCRALYTVKPYYVACILAKGGSNNEVIEHIKKRIGFVASGL